MVRISATIIIAVQAAQCTGLPILFDSQSRSYMSRFLNIVTPRTLSTLFSTSSGTTRSCIPFLKSNIPKRSTSVNMPLRHPISRKFVSVGPISSHHSETSPSSCSSTGTIVQGHQLQISSPHDPNEESKTEMLRFGGDLTFVSNPLPFCETLIDFFASPNHQQILWNRSNSSLSDLIFYQPHFSQQANDRVSFLWEKWKMQCAKVHAKPPDAHSTDYMIQVQPSSMDMVGIKIIPQTMIGITFQTYPRSEEENYPISSTRHIHRTIDCLEQDMESEWAIKTPFLVPELQAVLIDDTTRAEGPPFLVWLFNRICYGDPVTQPVDHKTRKGSTPKVEEENAVRDRTLLSDQTSTHMPSCHANRNHHTQALLRVWAEPILDPTNCTDSTVSRDPMIVFKTSVSMWLEIRFPKVLLRFFPMSTSKAEELCSSAIRKALVKSCSPALDEFCNAYSHWVAQSRSLHIP